MKPTTITQQQAATGISATAATTDTPARPRLETPESAWTRTGVGRATAYELMGRGAYPQPVKLGRAIRYVADEIDSWIFERITERDATLQARGLHVKSEVA